MARETQTPCSSVCPNHFRGHHSFPCKDPLDGSPHLVIWDHCHFAITLLEGSLKGTYEAHQASSKKIQKTLEAKYRSASVGIW
jgi:hypothetical protein